MICPSSSPRTLVTCVWALLTVVQLHMQYAQATCVRNATAGLLPSTITPSNYAIRLSLPDPNMAANNQDPLMFDGSVAIDATTNVNAPSSTCIILNAGSKMNISGVSIDGDLMLNTMIEHDRDNEQLVLTLPPGKTLKSSLVVNYTGVLFDDTTNFDANERGLFLSPNTVPPATAPASDNTANVDGEDGLQRWSLHSHQREPTHTITPKRQQRDSWRSSLRNARARGDPLMLATQFEESDARHMFPCFDEPAYKATFEAAIDVPTTTPPLTVFFNTAELSAPELLHTNNSDKQLFRFKRTLNPLPTYLVATAVGTFDIVSATSRDVRYRVITPVGHQAWATLALNATIHAIEFFGDRFGLAYSEMNEKLDSISVGGIDMDAMENQGLVTYAPQMLLLNPNASELPPQPLGEAGRYTQAQLIVFVTTHELLHQWFGDTVTMRWWSQEYLNEGFARLMQSYGADDLVPEWDTMCLTGRGRTTSNSFFRFTYEIAQTFDAAGTAPAIVYPLPGGGDEPPFPKPPSETTSSLLLDPTKAPLFSRMFYEKGASVNRMVALHMGWAQWNKALGHQLQMFKWENPTVEDLMRSLDLRFNGMNKSLSAMDAVLPWLRRPNFPVVTLSFDTDLGVVRASQAPISKYVVGDANKNAPWWIPLQLSLDGGASPFVFEFNTATATMKPPPSSLSSVSTLVGDPAFWGVFIVRYNSSDEWTARITTVVARHAMEPDYTRELLSHVFLLVTMGTEPVQLLTQLLTSLTPTLAMNKVLGGWEGEGDLYSMILTRVAPIVTVLRGLEVEKKIGEEKEKEGEGEGDSLVTALRHMTGELVMRLEKVDFTDVHNPQSQHVHNGVGEGEGGGGGGDGEGGGEGGDGDGGTPPWPQNEDSGIEARARNALRPSVILAAVTYGDVYTVGKALTLFRSHTTALPAMWSRPTYFAVARFGEAADKMALDKLFRHTIASPSVDMQSLQMVEDLLFGISAGGAGSFTRVTNTNSGNSVNSINDTNTNTSVTDTRDGDVSSCTYATTSITSAATWYSHGDNVAKVDVQWFVMSRAADLLTYADATCRTMVWSKMVATTSSGLWKILGADATAQIITTVFPALRTATELQMAQSLLATQNAVVVTPDQANAALTLIKINMDAIAANSQ